MTGAKFSVHEVLDAIATRYHPPGSWLFLRELRLGTGHGKDSEQRVDAWAMHLWPSRQNRRVAYEVKTSRSDLLRELRTPRKRTRALLRSNEFYFVVSEGLLTLEELPAECGLITATTLGLGLHVEITEPAPWRDTPPPTWLFVGALLRHAGRIAEERRDV